MDLNVDSPVSAELIVAIGLALLLQDRESAGPEGKLAALRASTDQIQGSIQIDVFADQPPWILLNDESMDPT